MSADQDFHCSKAPTPVPNQDPAKTDKIVHEEPDSVAAGNGKGWYVLGAFLALAIVAGVVFTLVNGSGGAAKISASTETVAEGQGSSESVAIATPTDSPPKECVGEITDPTIGYYCNHILPMAKAGKADHARIDRL